ncbi:glycoside hydrolase family 28 protein [Aquabacterium sp. OR-4]|uniref:glycoside hydrolase family 28 protein n=1 Tax=Aquabacterium sp. OR-4 TaxID=2978127 RepID=UPI0021B4AF33|nr:glycosyl hydrolase family 28 protein [Aquabacterium sp. OR-4]MDT7838893.1 glycosyl hydrolase family 28 protein [Aquabacterium sp. OR-4]
MIDPREHGARADGHTLDTAALQTALDAAARVPGGATVRLPPGVCRSGALFVPGGVGLQVPAGATLRGSTALADYPLIDTRVAGIEMRWPAALLNVIDAERVVICGEGTIDGDGAGFWAGYWALREAYTPRGLRWASDYDAQRPRLLLLQRARNVFVGGGLTLRRSGFWTLQVCYSREVRIDRVTIRNNDDGRGPSTDGIDIDSSERVLVRRADIAVNDDAIAFKAGRDADGLRVARPVRDVLVAACTVHDGATGIAFGSETSGGFERVRVRRLRVHAPVPVGVLIKSARTRGGWARGLRLADIHCEGVAVPLRITLDWNPAYSRAVLPEAERAQAPAHWLTLAAPVPARQGLMQVQGVQVHGLVARGASTAFEVDADAQSPLCDVHFAACDIEAAAGGHVLDAQGWRFERCRLAWAVPLVLHDALAVQGLPPAAWRVDAQHPRRDVSTLGMHVQDVS